MRSSEAQGTKRLAEFDSNCALLAAPVATPLETLQILMLRARRRSPRSSSYIEHVQRDGMTASWRHKMSHWMFEVGDCNQLSSCAKACVGRAHKCSARNSRRLLFVSTDGVGV